MNRELKFLIRNSLNYDNAKEHIKTVCDIHDIKEYSFKPYVNDEVALWIDINGKQFVAYLDHRTLETKVSTGAMWLEYFL